MKRICLKTAAVVVLVNLAAIFYLNFSNDLTLATQFLALPWLMIQSLLVLSFANSCEGER